MLKPETEKVWFPDLRQLRHDTSPRVESMLQMSESPYGCHGAKTGVWRGSADLIAPIALGQEDLCMLPASFDGFYVMMMGGGGLLKTGTCVWHGI